MNKMSWVNKLLTLLQNNKLKYSCNVCNGCIHNKLKYNCKKCDGCLLCHRKWCEISGNKKYKNYCKYYFIHLFPDDPLVKNYILKEKDVIERILYFFPNF